MAWFIGTARGAGQFPLAEDAPAEALLEHLKLALCEPVEPPRDTAAYLR